MISLRVFSTIFEKYFVAQPVSAQKCSVLLPVCKLSFDANLTINFPIQDNLGPRYELFSRSSFSERFCD